MTILQKLFACSKPPEALPEHATLIDVRSPAEFALGHVEAALSIPLVLLSHEIGKAVPDKDAPIIVYCLSGGRSASARTQLLGMGYRNVFNGGGVANLAERMQRKIVR